jgi:branched-chain amino acid transport system permease protein
MVVLGGLGSVWGAALGGVLLVLVAEGLREVLPWVGLPQSARYLVFGLVMIAVIRWRPKGLVSRR